MDIELIRQLMSGERAKAPLTKYAILRGGEKVALTTNLTKEVGAYTGKQGSVKRSRKGRSVIQPNGERYYLNGNPDVIAYKV